MMHTVKGEHHWTYQCHQCFIKDGYGFTGTEIEAYNNAPTCCGGEPMHAIKGQGVIDGSHIHSNRRRPN